MRGKLNRITEIAMAGRITPADAGKTKRLMVDSFGDMDHPRGCGENYLVMSLVDITIGSPPRMRGKRRTCPAAWAQRRITPADAGKTQYRSLSRISAEDPPRGCGENLPASYRQAAGKGSPPRMRGKQLVHFLHGSTPRITPADAGKTFVFSSWRQQQQDHPRGCGENCIQHSRFRKLGGSPPRMRGKL